MKAKLELELQPFTTPNFVRLAVDPVDASKEGFPIPLKDLDAETLEDLCIRFRADVFKKAGKQDPQFSRPVHG